MADAMGVLVLLLLFGAPMAAVLGWLVGRKLERVLRRVEHRWWFSETVGWVSVSRSATGAVDVVQDGEPRRVFATPFEAQSWLSASEFVEGERARASRLVLDVPPPAPPDA